VKGYSISFSIDATFSDRVAFKFTVQDSGVNVGAERVRRDFREYIEKVRGGAESLDNLPVIASIEEHELLLTVLKNRISFLQHSYQLSQNTIQLYERLFTRANSLPALPAPTVVVQTGGHMDSRNYNATNSSRLIQGESNEFSDSSKNINIGRSFNERRQRIDEITALIDKLHSSSHAESQKAILELEKVKEELSEHEQPSESAISRWLNKVKDVLKIAEVGHEVVQSAQNLLHSFGIPWT
jgi:hypothetical protein